MRAAPRGFYGVCGSILAAAAAVIGVNLAHHVPAAGGARASGGRAVVAASPSASASGPSALPSTSPGPVRAAARSTVPQPVASPSSVPSPRPTPGPPHSPNPGPGAAIVGVVVPLRGSTPVALRAAVVVPAAPPFPGLKLALLLP